MSMLKTFVLGRMGGVAEVKTTANGKTWGTFSVAVNAKKGNEKTTMWVKVKCFDQLANIAGDFGGKGREVFVEGRPEVEAWLPAGTITPRTNLVVIADRIDFLGGKEQDTTPKDDAAIAVNDSQGNQDQEWY